MPTNWMRTSAFSHWTPFGPYLEYYPSKINDGQIVDLRYTRNNAYIMTVDRYAYYNLGVGSDIRFTQALTLRTIRMYAYIKPVTEITIEYYSGNSLLLKYIRPLSRVERRLAENWFTYSIPNAPAADRVRIYISGWDDAQNDFDLYQGLLWNYYAFEIEAYSELFLTDVLTTWRSGEWIAPFALLTYRSGEWIREGMPMSYHDADWNEFV